MTHVRSGLYAALLLGGTMLSGTAMAEPLTLTILHVNDLDRMEEANGRGGFARIAGLVGEVGAGAEHVLLTHGGDAISPSLLSAFDKGHHIIDLMNHVHVSAFVPGNHEFDFGPEVAVERFAEAEFPVLSSNILDGQGQPLAHTQATLMMDVGPYKIGFMGLTTPETVEIATTGDLTFEPVVEAAKRVGAELRDQGADLVIALGHTGMDEDLALVHSGAVDLVLSGHDQVVWSYYDGRAAGAEAYSQGDYVAEIDITMDKVTSADQTTFTWRPEFRTLDTADFAPDPAVAAAVQTYLDQLSKELDVEIGTAETPLDSRRAVVRSQEAAIGNLIADAMRDAVDADIAITNGGGIRADKEYAAGTHLTRRDIQSELPFGNRTVKLEVTGADILAALENGFSQVEATAGRFPQVSGLAVRWDPSKPPGARVVSVTIGDKPLDPEATYTLATNDFMANGGDGYVAFQDAPRLIGPVDAGIVANQVMDYVAAAGAISPAVEGRITTAE